MAITATAVSTSQAAKPAKDKLSGCAIDWPGRRATVPFRKARDSWRRWQRRDALIDEHGVKGLVLSDAAHLAGVSIAAPYRHFRDKEALLAEIAAEGFAMFRDALARAAQTQPEDKVKRLVEMGVAYVEFALQHRSHFKVMWEGGICKADYVEMQ